MKIAKIASILISAILSALPAFSENLNEKEIFDVNLRGIKVGFIGYVAKTDGSQYSLSFGVRSTGILDLIQNVEINARANGRVVDGEILPVLYVEDSKIGKKTNHVVLEYESGVPKLVEKVPPIDESKPLLDPLEQAGTLDPLSSLYMIFRSSAKADLCDKEFFLFDGVRRAQILMGKPAWDNEKAVCECQFVRIAGYSQSELKSGREFPFTLIFEATSGNSSRYNLALLEGESKFGKIRIERRIDSP